MQQQASKDAGGLVEWELECRRGRVELAATFAKMGRQAGEWGKALSWWSLMAAVSGWLEVWTARWSTEDMR